MPVFQTWADQGLCNYTSCSSMPLLFLSQRSIFNCIIYKIPFLSLFNSLNHLWDRAVSSSELDVFEACFPKAGYRSSCVFLPLLYKLIILCNSQSQIQSSKLQRNGAKIVVALICFLCFRGDEIVFEPRIYQMFVAFSRMYPGANIE